MIFHFLDIQKLIHQQQQLAPEKRNVQNQSASNASALYEAQNDSLTSPMITHSLTLGTQEERNEELDRSQACQASGPV